MEGEADRDDLRFRLDWPDGASAQPGEELTDFSFEWDEAAAEDEAAPEPAEPQFYEPVETVDAGRDTAFLDSTEALDTVRRALDENNGALRQLSEAVLELASNVRLLVDEVEGITPGSPMVADVHAGDVTATAMVTMSAELTSSIERMASELQSTRADLQGVMDDVVAAAGGAGVEGPNQPRIVIELDRIHNELQALKRRMPVRARELDAAEIAEQVAEIVLAVLDVEPEPVAPPPARKRQLKAAPVEPPPRRAAKRERPLRAD